jgi:hypothetical protein
MSVSLRFSPSAAAQADGDVLRVGQVIHLKAAGEGDRGAGADEHGLLTGGRQLVEGGLQDARVGDRQHLRLDVLLVQAGGHLGLIAHRQRVSHARAGFDLDVALDRELGPAVPPGDEDSRPAEPQHDEAGQDEPEAFADDAQDVRRAHSRRFRRLNVGRLMRHGILPY